MCASATNPGTSANTTVASNGNAGTLMPAERRAVGRGGVTGERPDEKIGEEIGG
jgi:hypothetical protein